jgi:hypothetical protein
MEREKEVGIYQKIVPPKTLVNREVWKVSLLRGMYVARLLALIQIIWLKGSRFIVMIKIDELCNVGQSWGEGELVCCSL